MVTAGLPLGAGPLQSVDMTSPFASLFLRRHRCLAEFSILRKHSVTDALPRKMPRPHGGWPLSFNRGATFGPSMTEVLHRNLTVQVPTSATALNWQYNSLVPYVFDSLSNISKTILDRTGACQNSVHNKHRMKQLPNINSSTKEDSQVSVLHALQIWSGSCAKF